MVSKSNITLLRSVQSVGHENLGVDSSYHICTNVSVRKGILFEALVYVLHLRERYYFSLVCIFKKVIILFFEVKVDVQKGVVRFREKFNTRCVSFIQFTFIHCCYMVNVLNDSLVCYC
jgi:hypothetical protein